MHVIFGRPLSVRQLCEGKINRCQYNLIPRSGRTLEKSRYYFLPSIIQSHCATASSSPLPGRDLPQQPSAQAQACVSWLAHLVVRLQEQGSLISPWSLMSCLLLQAPPAVLTQEGLPWQRLAEETLWLRGLAKDFGARLNWPGRRISDMESVVTRSGGVAAVNRRNSPLSFHLINTFVLQGCSITFNIGSYFL